MQVERPVIEQPRLVERIWGMEHLPAWYAQPAAGHPVGEAWLTGEGHELLVKMLFPREWLSVQVHPDDAEARALGQPRGKTECWYVVSAEPGATVGLGLRGPMEKAEVRAAIADGTLFEHMQQLPVAAGDLVYVEAGTLHAIGPGAVLLETQQNSDVTYRLWDYGRPRELHVEQGLAVLKPHTASGPVAPVPMPGFTRLVEAPFFTVDRFLMQGEADLKSHAGETCLVALGEGCSIAGAWGETALPPGWAVWLPAATAATLRGHDAEVIRIQKP